MKKHYYGDMLDQGYSPSEKRRGRKIFNIFLVFNTLSFSLLIGNFLTIYALRLGASSILIGVLSSMAYVSFFFMPIGKQLVSRFGVVKSMGTSWLLRYLLSIPIALSSIAAIRGANSIALFMVVLGIAGFHIFRGFGVVSNSPLVGELSAGKDRGSFLARTQIISHIAAIGSGLAVSFLLGPQAPLGRYGLFISAGIICGFIASILIYQIPEPPAGVQSANQKLSDAVRTVIGKRLFRRFFFAYGGFIFAANMVRPFIIVYAKQVYLLNDSEAVFFTVVGSLGVIFMGLITRQFLDRYGAKPIILISIAISLISLIPAVLSPVLSGTALIVFLFVLFFAFNLGTVGGENGCQTYFYSIILPKERVTLGMVYFITMGIMGALGSFAGGLLLDALAWVGTGGALAQFRIFLIITIALHVPVLIAMGRIERLGAKSVRSTLSTLFSIKDMKAVALLNRLDTTNTMDEEREVIKEIGTSQSSLPIEDLLKKIEHPSFIIRNEALFALEKLPASSHAVEALINHIRRHEFTTAYQAARILGNKEMHEGVPVLRDSLHSKDYLLVSRAMIALARLKDDEILPVIEELLLSSDNPMVLMHGVSALKLFAFPDSIPVLFRLLSRDQVPPFLREEIIFSIAGIIGMEDWFYPVFMEFREDRGLACRLLIDELKDLGQSVKSLLSLCNPDLIGNEELAEKISKEFLTVELKKTPWITNFIEAAENRAISSLERGSFFLLSTLVWLRKRVKMEKLDSL